MALSSSFPAVEVGACASKEGKGLGAEIRVTDRSRKKHQWKEESPQSPQGREAMEIKHISEGLNFSWRNLCAVCQSVGSH